MQSVVVDNDVQSSPSGAERVGHSVRSTRRWRSWRGSPELLAHVARVAARCASLTAAQVRRLAEEYENLNATLGEKRVQSALLTFPIEPNSNSGDEGQATCMIDVEVDGDHEMFASARDFVHDVTIDALRRFASIQIDVVGPEMHVVVRLQRPQKVFKPDDLIKYEGVTLEVLGRSPLAVEAAVSAMTAALKRGGARAGRGEGYYRRLQAASGAAFGVAVIFVTTFTYYLVLKDPEFSSVLVIAFPLVLIAVAVAGFWAYPALEVAPRGETRIWRLTKVMGGLALGLVATALGRVAFGS